MKSGIGTTPFEPGDYIVWDTELSSVVAFDRNNKPLTWERVVFIDKLECFTAKEFFTLAFVIANACNRRIMPFQKDRLTGFVFL